MEGNCICILWISNSSHNSSMIASRGITLPLFTISKRSMPSSFFVKSTHYLADIENKGQHPGLQIFFELMLRYNIPVDQFLLEQPAGKNTRRQFDTLLGE